MPNLVEVNYGQTGKSTHTDALGMREMQARAFGSRDAQHLLIKAPPASGKSRALRCISRAWRKRSWQCRSGQSVRRLLFVSGGLAQRRFGGGEVLAPTERSRDIFSPEKAR